MVEVVVKRWRKDTAHSEAQCNRVSHYPLLAQVLMNAVTTPTTLSHTSQKCTSPLVFGLAMVHQTEHRIWES